MYTIQPVSTFLYQGYILLAALGKGEGKQNAHSRDRGESEEPAIASNCRSIGSHVIIFLYSTFNIQEISGEVPLFIYDSELCLFFFS